MLYVWFSSSLLSPSSVSEIGNCFCLTYLSLAIVPFLCHFSIPLAVLLKLSFILLSHGLIFKELQKCGFRDGDTEK